MKSTTSLLLLLLVLALAVVAQAPPNRVLLPVVTEVSSPAANEFGVFFAKQKHAPEVVRVDPAIFKGSDGSLRKPIFIVYDSLTIDASLLDAPIGGWSSQPLSNVSKNGPQWSSETLRAAADLVAAGEQVTLLNITKAGLHLAFEGGMPRDIILAALVRFDAETKRLGGDFKANYAKEVETQAATKIEEVVKRLKAFGHFQALAPESVTNSHMAQLEKIAHALRRNPNRKAVILISRHFSLELRGSEGIMEFEPRTRYANVRESVGMVATSSTSGLVAVMEPPRSESWQMTRDYDRMIQALNEARVSLYPLQAGGNLAGLNRLRTLAANTGGKVLEYGEVKPAIAEAVRDCGPYYLLAVERPTAKKFGFVSVSVTAGGTEIERRVPKGFLSIPPEEKK